MCFPGASEQYTWEKARTPSEQHLRATYQQRTKLWHLVEGLLNWYWMNRWVHRLPFQWLQSWVDWLVDWFSLGFWNVYRFAVRRLGVDSLKTCFGLIPCCEQQTASRLQHIEITGCRLLTDTWIQHWTIKLGLLLEPPTGLRLVYNLCLIIWKGIMVISTPAESLKTCMDNSTRFVQQPTKLDHGAQKTEASYNCSVLKHQPWKPVDLSAAWLQNVVLQTNKK